MTALLLPLPTGSRLAQAEPLTRDAARDAARSELSRPEYAEAQPPLLLRLVGRALRFVGDLLDRATGLGNGTVARVLLLLVLAGVVAVVLVRLGPLGRRRRPRALFGGEPARTAAAASRS